MLTEEEQNQLIVDNMGLAAWWANRYTGCFDDNFQIALEGLIKAVRAGKTIPQCNGYMRAALSNALKRRIKWSDLNSVASHPVEVYATMESSPDVSRDLDKLDECMGNKYNYRHVLYGKAAGYTAREMAEELGISVPFVFKKLKYLRDVKLERFKPE